MSNIPTPLISIVAGLDFNSPQGRLVFFERLAGGNDRYRLYPVTITAEMAEWMLSMDKLCIANRQRRKSSKKVQEIARQMHAGMWKDEAGVPLGYSESGWFANGYGRFAGQVVSGKTIAYLMNGPLTVDQILAMDRGHSRTQEDMLIMQWNVPPEFQPHLFKEAAELLRHQIRRKVTPFGENEAEQTLLTERFLPDYMALYPEVASKRAYAMFRVPAVMAAFSYAHHMFKAPVLDYWAELVANDGLRRGTPMGTLHDLITAEATKQGKSESAQKQMVFMAKVLHCISAALNKRTLKAAESTFIEKFEDPIWNAHYLKSTPLP